jgi:hypothetical protein
MSSHPLYLGRCRNTHLRRLLILGAIPLAVPIILADAILVGIQRILESSSLIGDAIRRLWAPLPRRCSFDV